MNSIFFCSFNSMLKEEVFSSVSNVVFLLIVPLGKFLFFYANWYATGNICNQLHIFNQAKNIVWANHMKMKTIK